MQSNSKAVYVHVLHLGIKWKFAVRKNVNRGPGAQWSSSRHLSCFFRAIFNFLFAERYHISLKKVLFYDVNKKWKKSSAAPFESEYNLVSSPENFWNNHLQIDVLLWREIEIFACDFKMPRAVLQLTSSTWLMFWRQINM